MDSSASKPVGAASAAKTLAGPIAAKAAPTAGLSGFDPAVAGWFENAFGQPTPAQRDAWPLIAGGEQVLIAAPTGSGKTLAAFLAVIDQMVREASLTPLADECRVLYISPLKALSNDIRKNLEAPLNGIADALLEAGRAPVEIRAMVRTGDTSTVDRERMRRRPPHILVTTPESVFILLGSESGRRMLASVRHIIVDEIHAVAGNKRGAHLGLSLARLEALCAAKLQRIGLSATQHPIGEVARYLCADAPCRIVDSGHRRERQLALEVPRSPLTAVMANEVWGEIYDRLAELAAECRTTLVFVNTRRLAERATKHLAERLGEEAVMAHHGSLAKEHRLAAEQALKAGRLKLLVATASLELGIDIGDVDLVCQIGSPRGINTFLQRVGRSGHAVHAVPRGHVFPTSLDELVECTALLRAVGDQQLDRLRLASPALDVLAQHIVAEVAAQDWSQHGLYAQLRRCACYAALSESQYLAVLQMLAEGYSSRRGRRGAYLHWDRVNGLLRARRGARLVALTNAGVIPDQFDFDVILSPDGFKIGTLGEDFAFESLPGDIFQLGNQSYRVLKVESGRVLAQDAQGLPPTLPFWFGEAPGRSDELSLAVSALRSELGEVMSAGVDAGVDWLTRHTPLTGAAAKQLADYLAGGQAALGAMPTQDCVVLERFFDDTGDMHLVIHSPFGSRLNKAWGLALRKRFCRQFNFELQAAALEDSIVLSLGITHSFPLEEVSRYLHPDSVRGVLEQALLDAPMFPTHWRWNASIALAIRRHLGNRRSPPIWQRNDAEDLMAVVFPDQIACAENLAGPRQIPDHPLVTQTVEDCLFEIMDLPGLERLLGRLQDGSLRVVCVDLSAPSPLAQEILNARPYAFLDDGDAEGRRTMAVSQPAQRSLEDIRSARQLSPELIAQIQQQAWPTPRDAEELHDSLVIYGFLCESECAGWQHWLEQLIASGRATRLRARERGQLLVVAAERLAQLLALHPQAQYDPPIALLACDTDQALRELLRGRLEALGPVTAQALANSVQVDLAAAEQALLALEQEGFVIRGEFGGAGLQWCERRLLARIHRASREHKRAAHRPVAARHYQQFLLDWQGLSGERAEGPDAILAALDRLEGYSAPAAIWEQELLPARIALYLPGQLDALCAAGKASWARLTPRSLKTRGTGPVKQTPIAFAPREALAVWRGLAMGDKAQQPELSESAHAVVELLKARGAAFFSDLVTQTGLLRAQLEAALGELVGSGLVSADTFAGLRSLISPQRAKPRSAPRTRRRRPLFSGVQDAGRWFLLPDPSRECLASEDAIEHFLWAMLSRYGVVFRRLLERESVRVAWRDLLRVAWRLEARGEIQGGRFVDGEAGEQFALPEAAEALQRVAKAGERQELLRLSVADPANLAALFGGPALSSRAGNVVLFEGTRPVAWLDGGEPQTVASASPEQRARWLAELTQPGGLARARQRRLGRS